MNSDYHKDVTIIIVTFFSHSIIKKCLDNLDNRYKKIIVENSSDLNFTANLKQEYDNLECINIGYDSGFGYAVNQGIKKSQTKYILLMNPDSFPEKDCIDKIVTTANNDESIAAVAPITLIKNKTKEFDHYGYFDGNQSLVKDSKNLLQVDWVNANIFLIKKEVFDKIGLFDENIFIECEELDLQKRISKINKKIIIDFNAKSLHLEGKSTDSKFAFEMKCEAAWHNSWSNFYFLKKHYSWFRAFSKRFPKAIFDFFKFSIFFILGNKKKSKIYLLYFLGFCHSCIGKKATYRAEIIQ